jgi:opacity protein-like surface antigen
MRFQRVLVHVIASVVAVSAIARVCVAQGDLLNSLTVTGGAFAYDYGDHYSPFASVSFGRSLNRYVELEGTAGYARLTTRLYQLAPTVTSYDVGSAFLTADVGLNLMLPLGPFVPYVGMSTGAFRRNQLRDNSNGIYAGAVNGNSRGVAIGARLLFGERLGLRGEFRYREDSHNGSDTPANDFVQSVGLIYRF